MKGTLTIEYDYDKKTSKITTKPMTIQVSPPISVPTQTFILSWLVTQMLQKRNNEDVKKK